jgi:hypothetical protein
MNSGIDYIDKILTELAESSYGNADTEQFTLASHLLHECIHKAREESYNLGYLEASKLANQERINRDE